VATRDDGPVTLSVLDRLIDRDVRQSSEVPLTRAQSVRELKAALKRDLQWLLNTRRTIEPAADSARETVRSVYHYGFADISSRSLLSSKDQTDLVRDMENTIAVFEPRLKHPKVRMEIVEGGFGKLRFIIEGLLWMDPAPEAVRFDTMVEPSKGEYRVMGEDVAQ